MSVIFFFSLNFTALLSHGKPEEKGYTIPEAVLSFLVRSLVQNIDTGGRKSSQKVAKSQGAGAALTHGQCLSADGRRKACSMSIFAKLLLCVYLCKAVRVCFLYTEVFEVRSEPPINDFYKSEGPAGPAERCLLAISWITNFISKYYPDCKTVDWLVSEKQIFSHVQGGFFCVCASIIHTSLHGRVLGCNELTTACLTCS